MHSLKKSKQATKEYKRVMSRLIQQLFLNVPNTFGAFVSLALLANIGFEVKKRTIEQKRDRKQEKSREGGP